jgi:hypothetical protein
MVNLFHRLSPATMQTRGVEVASAPHDAPLSFTIRRHALMGDRSSFGSLRVIAVVLILIRIIVSNPNLQLHRLLARLYQVFPVLFH